MKTKYRVALLVLVIVLMSVSTAQAQTPTVAKFSGYNVKSDNPEPTWKPIFGDWYHVDTVEASALKANPAVKMVEPNYQAHVMGWVSDPRFADQWHLYKTQTDVAWDYTKGAGVTVAVLDTGVDPNHPDLAGKVYGDLDDHGHGTHVAGIITARANNGVGVAGAAYETRVWSVKVLDSQGTGGFDDIAAGMHWVANTGGVAVINLSIGCTGCPSIMMEEAANYVKSKGIVAVGAAGNDNSIIPSSPAQYMLSVGATDRNDTIAQFSNYGDWVQMSAPGVSILSTVRNNGYEEWNGTSMATPQVAAAAALIRASCPLCTVDDIIARLVNGDPITVPGGKVAGRRLNTWRAVADRDAPTPRPTPTFLPTPTSTVTFGPEQQRLLYLINQNRQRWGLNPLSLDTRITAAAQDHIDEMLNCIAGGHSEADCAKPQLPDGTNPDQRLWRRGFYSQWTLESVIYGTKNADETLAALFQVNSEWEKMMTPGATYVGIAFRDTASPSTYLGKWWVIDVTAPGGAATLTPSPTPTHTSTAIPTATKTPTPTITTTPSRTPVPTATLVSGWIMTVWVPYKQLIPTAIVNPWCGYGLVGVSCELAAKFDYDSADYDTVNRAYWEFYMPNRDKGFRVTFTRK